MRDKTITVYLRYNCLMKHFRLILLFVLLSLLFNTTPAYADGGIPLWIYTASSAAYSTFTIQGIGNFSFLLGTVFLLYVIFVEVLIFKFLDKDKQFKLKQIICSVTVANIFSVIAGIIITLPVLSIVKSIGMNNNAIIDLGFLVLPLHIITFIISYYIELFTYKKIFFKNADYPLLKKIALCTNIGTYFIFNILTIAAVIILIEFLIGYVSNALITTSNNNLSLLNSPVEINGVKIISPYFKPQKISHIACAKLKKKGYPISDCKYELYRDDGYWIWVDAIRQCGDINGRLPNNKELAHIAEYVYEQPFDSFSPLHETSSVKYNSFNATKANLPKTTPYLLLSSEFTGPYGIPDYRMYGNIFTSGSPNYTTKSNEDTFAICVAK